MISPEGIVSVVVRTMPGRRRELIRAIASIAASRYSFMEIIVVNQGEVDSVDLPRLREAARGVAFNLICEPATVDARAHNLNLGWAAAQGRYIAFLDDDDEVAPVHYGALVSALCSSGRAWAYARTALRAENAQWQVLSETFPFDRPQFSLLELWRQNFIPIHSFLIDRHRLPELLAQRPFCEKLTRGEDWDFLLRLAYHREPLYLNSVSSYYYVSADRSNTNQSIRTVEADTETAKRDAAEWARCKALILVRRKQLEDINWWADEYFIGAVEPVRHSHWLLAARQRFARVLARQLAKWI